VACVFDREEPRASGSYQGQTSSAPLKARDPRSSRQLLVNPKHNSRVDTRLHQLSKTSTTTETCS